MDKHIEKMEKDVVIPIELVFPQIDKAMITFTPYKPSILYRYCDHHAATDEEEAEYVAIINEFLSELFCAPGFIDFFAQNNCAVTREQISAFLVSANLQLQVPDTSKYYCYDESGYYVLNNSWLYDKRFPPTYHYCFDGVTYELTERQSVYPAYYMNQQRATYEGTSEWYYLNETDGFGSLFCLACKYLIPTFYKFYKDTDGVDSYFLSEYGVGFDECPGLPEALEFIKERITKVSFKTFDETSHWRFNSTLLYTNYDEVRSLIKLYKKTLKEFAES